MNVVDSSAWLEYFSGGPNAEHYDHIVRLTEKLVVPAIVLYEVFKVVLLESDENAALQVCASLQKGLVVDLDPRLAIMAAKISLHNHLPMADSIVLATAREYKAVLWTQDVHFKGIKNVKYFQEKH